MHGIRTLDTLDPAELRNPQNLFNYKGFGSPKRNLEFRHQQIQIHGKGMRIFSRVMKRNCCNSYHVEWIFAAFFVAAVAGAEDALTLGAELTRNQTIVSKNGQFELGFFSLSPGKWYVGVWYAGIPLKTYVWVANRVIAARDSASLKLKENGRLAVVNGGESSSVWETGNSRRASQVILLDSGNLVLVADENNKTQKNSFIVVWESFEYPTDTWMPGMKIRYGQPLTSWKSLTDPAPGDFSLQLRVNLLENGNPAELSEFLLLWRNSTSYWSSGKWDGQSFMYIPEMTVKYIYNFSFVNPNSTDGYFIYTVLPHNVISRFAIDIFGEIKQYTWTNQTNNWNMFWKEPKGKCRVYGLCGPNGVCIEDSNSNSNARNFESCQCLKGFRPKNPLAWNSEDRSGGCVRVDPLQCKTDQFYEFGNADVDKDNIDSLVIRGISNDKCKDLCMKNCSCVGYAYREGWNECRLLWGDLWDLRNCSCDDDDENGISYDSCVKTRAVVNVRIAACDLRDERLPRKVNPGILIGSLCGAVLFCVIVVLNVVCWKRWKSAKKSVESFHGSTLTMFAYRDLQIATRNFSEKLGSGGFGSVYKGVLSGSIPVAVKKLERPEGGEKQFRMEVSTIGTIQHVNLVRLRGFCSEGDRRLLVYDYMPNGSLNSFLFRERENVLDWETRFRIALGTARAISYLHEECRDCIIHCDIKPENILLDEDFNAKVSDFGLAKLIGRDFSRVLTTMRGTRGYLAPEWISGLPITAKADVYSFGMTLLEIIGGRRNIETSNVESEKWFFPPWAAKQVSLGNILELVDNHLAADVDEEEARRAAMVAIWCIQDDEDSRPTMGTIVKMLEGIVEVSIPPIPRSLQALMDENALAQAMTVDSDMASLDSSPSSSIVVVNASKNMENGSFASKD